MHSAICHTPGPARGAESTAFATDGHQFLVMAGLTSNTQEAVLQATTLQVILKLSDNCNHLQVLIKRDPLILKNA
jgi:hypothetical protein